MLRPSPPDMSTYEIEFHPDQDGLGAWADATFIQAGSAQDGSIPAVCGACVRKAA